MSSPEQEEKQPNPSEVNGNLKNLQGQAYAAIGSVIPGETGNNWVKSGEELQRDGQTEINNAKTKQAVESAVDGASAKVKSVVGYVTGDQAKQSEANVDAEKAQWKYKHATTESLADSVPIPSAEGVKGKLQSVQGMVTGDQGLQQEGNLRAEKAAWRDGV